MNKIPALIISLLLVSILFFITPKGVESEKESAIIIRVIDGDTIELSDKTIVRLLNINAPEKSALNHEQAALYLSSLINKSISIEITGTDKYNRALARIYAPEYVNLRLVELGLSSKFLVQNSELSQFAKAEQQAIENSQGMWKKSPLYGCFESEINKQAEYVTMTKYCKSTQWNGLILKDESRKSITISNISSSENTITIYTGYGENSKDKLYWNSKDSIWNNDRDSLYLFDSQGNIVEYESYGY